MTDKVLIIDTSILLVMLQVPYRKECGADGNHWDAAGVNDKIKQEQDLGTCFVLPLATIIETGNHIAHIQGDKYKYVKDFSDLVEKTIDNENPWIAFSKQSELLQGESLRQLLNRWRNSAIEEAQSLGDASIADVANYFLRAGRKVEIFTGDGGLKNYENKEVQDAILQPRRRKKK